ncbi:3-beta-hydroxysteroid-Delta(8),Delta(7)-isomerase [Lasiodiplodia theobromae]|uniref:3-beta-hydroxysteroid-Delta(8), Delta(7)-isomerase n=1 Tax=Lasiodiplodia theobromae TaxID=45133 RepID=A0A5N5D055_9PEZI|nr:3-beta-hydroxysteroid-Delta(8),Delta(7)-isomerase [Lasiodiplodia theobromae]
MASEIGLNFTQVEFAQHPYYPLGVAVVGYAANQWSLLLLLGAFAVAWSTVLGAAYFVVAKKQPTMPVSEVLTFMWFVLCKSSQHLFGQLWKEYSLSDSRYLTSDPFVLCMEAVTAICWGPLCMVLAYMMITNSPLRHPLQIVISLGQIYGDVLYFATNFFDETILGVTYCRPGAYYYWFYYFFFNAIWIFIPSILIWRSFAACQGAFEALTKQEASPKSKGAVKKE